MREQIKQSLRWSALLSVCSGLGIWWGCTHGEVEMHLTGETPHISAEDDMIRTKPFMIREAKLPAGFPPPGPVGEIVTKEYPTYRLARVDAGRHGVTTDQNAMFNPLFQHIKRNDIPMTAPVEMSYAEDVAQGDERPVDPEPVSMAFLYGEPTWGHIGADSEDQRVFVEDTAAMTVVSIGVRGRYSDATFNDALARLNEWLDAHRGEVRVAGKPRLMGYNSPFVPWFMRYAEVQVPIEWLEAARKK